MKTLSSLFLLSLFLPLDLWAAGELDTTFNPNVNGEIKALALAPDGKIFIGGSFTAVGGVETNRIARLLSNGDRDSNWSNKTAGPVPACITLGDGSVLVADPGSSTSSSTYVYQFSSKGDLDKSFSPIRVSEGQLHCMGLNSDGNLLLGGDFYMVASSSCRGFGIVGMDGVLKSHPISEMGPDSAVRKGVFTLLPQTAGSTVVGGNFGALDSLSRKHLAKVSLPGVVDGEFAPSLTIGSETSVLCLASLGPSGPFFAGGSFDQISTQGTRTSRCLARFSSTGARSGLFKPIFSHTTKVPRVTSIAVQADGKIIAAGDFTSVNSTSCKGLVRLKSDGTVDSSFNASAEGVTGVALQMDGKIIITGNFLEVNGVPRNRIARLNNDTAIDRLTIQQSRVLWTPLVSSPPGDQVNFDVSTDGKATWQSLGKVQGAGDTGWMITNLNLPRSGILRIRSRAPSGLQNGSSGFVEKEINYVLPSPEISVVELVNSSTQVGVTDGQTTPLDYGKILQGSSASKTLQIFNNSSTKLTITGIQLPPGFTWLNPVSLPTTVSNALTVTVQADSAVPGSYGGTVVIANDDLDESGFEFPLTATVVGPEIMVRVEEGELSNGQAEPISFAQGYQGTQQLRENVGIFNWGTSALNVSAISTTGGFTVDKPQPFVLQPGESRAIQVGPDQSVAGTLTGKLEIYSDDFDEPVFSVPLAATVLNPLVTKVVNTKTTLNRKSGLREQKLRISNTTKIAMVDGFRVIVRGLPEGVVVRNASEVLPDGSVVIEVHQPLGPGGKIVLVLEYEVPKGSPVVIYPQLTTEVIVNIPGAPKAAALVVAPEVESLAVEKCERTPEGDFALTFSSVPGRLYQVEYSADGKEWKATPPTRAAGSSVRWVDSGLPQTECEPEDAPKRLYRVRELE